MDEAECGEGMPLLQEGREAPIKEFSKNKTHEEFLSAFWVLFCSSACAVIALPFAFGS